MNALDPTFRPLARLAVRKGWLFQPVAQRLKAAFVHAAEYATDGTATDSKVSIMTGLQRRDITRLRSEIAPKSPPRQPVAEIIALWWNDPAYDPNGLPIQGEGASFDDLARKVRQDVHPRTFLDILIENGAVIKDGDKVRLVSRSYQPLAGSDDQLAYLSENVGDHLEAAVSNVIDTDRHYDMAVHYTGLSADAIAQLKSHYTDKMRELLFDLDTIARSLPQTEDAPHRFRAGGYFFDDTKPKETSDDT